MYLKTDVAVFNINICRLPGGFKAGEGGKVGDC